MRTTPRILLGGGLLALFVVLTLSSTYAACPNPCGCNPCPTVSEGAMILGVVRWPDYPSPLETYKVCCPEGSADMTGDEVRDAFGVWIEGKSDHDLVFPKLWEQDVYCHCYLAYPSGYQPYDPVSDSWTTDFNPYAVGTYTLSVTLFNPSVKMNSPGGHTTPPATCDTVQCPYSVIESRDIQIAVSVVDRPRCQYLYDIVSCLCVTDPPTTPPWPIPDNQMPPDCALYCTTYIDELVAYCPAGFGCCPFTSKTVPYYVAQFCFYNYAEEESYCFGYPTTYSKSILACCDDEVMPWQD